MWEWSHWPAPFGSERWSASPECSSRKLLYYCLGEVPSCALVCIDLSLQLAANGHELVDFGDDSGLFELWRHGDYTPAQLGHID